MKINIIVTLDDLKKVQI